MAGVRMPLEVDARKMGELRAFSRGVHVQGAGRDRRAAARSSQSVRSSASKPEKSTREKTAPTPARSPAKTGWSEGTEEADGDRGGRWTGEPQGGGCAMNTPKEATPATVAQTPTQAGETLSQRWPWVEPAVWTERMLTARPPADPR